MIAPRRTFPWVESDTPGTVLTTKPRTGGAEESVGGEGSTQRREVGECWAACWAWVAATVEVPWPPPSLLVDKGADPVAVQRHLGHRDVATTLRIYRHLFAGRTDQLVDALDALYVEAQAEIGSVPSVGPPSDPPTQGVDVSPSVDARN
jgi:hypothetical protein